MQCESQLSPPGAHCKLSTSAGTAFKLRRDDHTLPPPQGASHRRLRSSSTKVAGLANLRLGVPLKLREGGPFEPIAAKCRLGWGVYGRALKEPVARATVNFHTAAASSSDDLMNPQLRDFFTSENNGVVDPNAKLESDEVNRARKLLQDTTRRISTGFETGLLWKTDDPEFPETYPMAIRRMKALEKKFRDEPMMMQRISEQ